MSGCVPAPAYRQAGSVHTWHQEQHRVGSAANKSVSQGNWQYRQVATWPSSTSSCTALCSITLSNGCHAQRLFREALCILKSNSVLQLSDK